MKTVLKFATIFLALTISALASTIVTIDFTTLPSNTAGGYYVGYSQANITTALNQQFSSFDLICDDFVHTTNIPSGPFQYAVSTLPSLTDVRWIGNDKLKNYEIAAVLLYQFDQNLGTVDPGGYNFALWHLFNPNSAPNYGDSATLIANATNIVNAGGGITTDAYKQLRVFTPIGNSTSNQEFVGVSSNTFGGSPVPEPETLGLIGFALVGLSFLRRNLRTKRS